MSLHCLEKLLRKVELVKIILVLNFEEGPVLSASEEDTLFKILSNGGTTGSLSVLEELLRTLEQELFSEMALLNKIEKKEEEMVIGQQNADDSFDQIMREEGSNPDVNRPDGPSKDSQLIAHTQFQDSLFKACSTIVEAGEILAKARSNISDYLSK